ncbi:MAG: nodulation protein NfeD [Bacteroidales bacterium]|nr:nodulation protein NfeD [Bacteroidales bacterium]
MTQKKINVLLRYLALTIIVIMLPAAVADDSIQFDQDSTAIVKETETGKTILVFEIRDQISKLALRTTQKAFEEAERLKVQYIILHLNTYGGRVDFADTIRTKIINSDIPVFVFVNNQAISAGALISIACDSIYMRPGGSIGASTVVSGMDGAVAGEKAQSFMRSTMRATAESHGHDTIITENDTILKWHRNPSIAEAMVDSSIVVKDIVKENKLLTLTAQEAVKVGYCEGLANSVDEVIELAGLEDHKVIYYKATGVEKLIGFLLNPFVQGFFLLLIIGGIYFEFQTPGVGFPLAAAAVGAILYFAPLYLEGLAENWELALFIAGVILIAVEIFAIPGFGIAGVAGIICMLSGLTLSLIDNVVFEYEGWGAIDIVFKAFVQVIIWFAVALGGALAISRKVGNSNWFKDLALEKVQETSTGYISIDTHQKDMVGKTGKAFTVLRPSGRVIIDNEIFDAMAEIGYIEKDDEVRVTRDEAGQIYVVKA